MKDFWKSFVSVMGKILAFVASAVGLYFILRQTGCVGDKKSKAEKILDKKAEEAVNKNEEIIKDNTDYLNKHSADEFKLKN